MSVNAYKNKKIVIMGLGLNGGGVKVAKFFAKKKADVLVTDLKTREKLKSSIEELNKFKIKYVLGRHREKDFTSADLIIKNPAVSKDSHFLKLAGKNNIEVKTDVEIFFDLCGAKIIGVTGTKGKTTTATLIYLFLKKKYKKVFLAGNMGLSPLDILDKIDKDSWVVLELSSFELEDLRKSPHVAVITNIFPDHLDRYKKIEEYAKAKKNIFIYQDKEDILLLNSQNKITKKFAELAKSKVYFFEDDNVSSAKLVARILKVSQKDMESVLQKFKGVPHRQEFILEKKGVKYYNDTAATNPGATIYAINKFKNTDIVLIVGGMNKGLNYKQLCREINKNVNAVILLPGTASDIIKKNIKDFEKAFSMEEAVKKASQLAKRGDIVILSPASASFNLFENEFDRGRQFINYVKKL